MKIAIDIDDTLTNSFDYFIPFVAEFFGAAPEQLRRDNISYSTLPEEWRKREPEFCRAYYDRVVPDTPFRENAVRYVNLLHEEGHRIVIITARTREMYTDPYATTRAELDKNGLQYDEIVCTMDKTRACTERGIDLLIDDSVANCRAAASAGVRVLLFSGKGNAGTDVPFARVNDWEEIYLLIRRGLPTTQSK